MPPRRDRVTAIGNVMLFPEGIPVAAPERWATGQLGPSSMLRPWLCGGATRRTASVPMLQGGLECAAGQAYLLQAIARRVAGVGLPPALQPVAALDRNPMTVQHRVWTPALRGRAAKTRSVVIGMDMTGRYGPARSRRHAP